jgi:hypothetical protein
MVRHQTTGVASPPVALDHFAESVQKEEAIPVVQEDRLASVAPGGDSLRH